MEWQAVQAKTVMDETSKEVKFSKQRVTDLPTCRRIEVPEAREDDTEVVFANMKTRLSKVTESYIKEKCDNKGNIKEQNVGKQELDGLKSLKKRVGNGELLIIPTDKSGKLVVSSHEDYIASMQPHIANDETISLEERNTIENTLNGHTIQLG